MTPEQVQLIEDCEKRESKLTAWEHDFIVSMRDRVPDGYVSEKQAARLEEIWERVT